jgi:hypothetical protein
VCCQIDMSRDGFIINLLEPMDQLHRFEFPDPDLEQQKLCASRTGGECDCCKRWLDLPGTMRAQLKKIMAWEATENKGCVGA